MKMSQFVVATLAAGGIATASLTSPALAGADSWGSKQQLSDNDGQVVQVWTVSDLRPSSDTLSGVDLHGKLYEATAAVYAKEGDVTPVIPNFHARSGATDYGTLWYAFSPNGVPAATVQQGDHATGKLYFDVDGPAPTEVVYNNGLSDLMTWGS